MWDVVNALVSFRRNSKLPVEDYFRDTKRGFTSKYIGFFQDGSFGVIFPGNQVIEEVIEEMEKQCPAPWPIRLFVRKVGKGIFLAFAIDDFITIRNRFFGTDAKRIEQLEQKVHELETTVSELKILLAGKAG